MTTRTNFIDFYSTATGELLLVHDLANPSDNIWSVLGDACEVNLLPTLADRLGIVADRDSRTDRLLLRWFSPNDTKVERIDDAVFESTGTFKIVGGEQVAPGNINYTLESRTCTVRFVRRGGWS